MNDFIEIFYSTRDARTPYHAIIWRSGVVVEVIQYERLAPLTTFWSRHQLPVLCTDEQIRKQLRLCGIPVQTPLPRRKGSDMLSYGSVGVEDGEGDETEAVEGDA